MTIYQTESQIVIGKYYMNLSRKKNRTINLVIDLVKKKTAATHENQFEFSLHFPK